MNSELLILESSAAACREIDVFLIDQRVHNGIEILIVPCYGIFEESSNLQETFMLFFNALRVFIKNTILFSLRHFIYCLIVTAKCKVLKIVSNTVHLLPGFDIFFNPTLSSSDSKVSCVALDYKPQLSTLPPLPLCLFDVLPVLSLLFYSINIPALSLFFWKYHLVLFFPGKICVRLIDLLFLLCFISSIWYITMSEIIAGPLLLRAIGGQNISESILVLSKDLESQSSSLVLSPTTSWNALNFEATSLSAVMTVAATNLKFPSESSIISSKPTSDPVAGLQRINSQFLASVTPSGLISKTNLKNSTQVAPNTIIAVPPDNSVTEYKNNFDAIHDSNIAPSLNPWSITGVIVGLVAITSLTALTIYLMGKRKRRRLIKFDLISHRSSSNLNKPFEPFTSVGQKNKSWENSSSRIQNFVCKLKFKLKGNRLNSFQYRGSSQEKINLDRGNSQFFEDIFDYNERNKSSMVHCLTGSPRGYATRWSARHKNEIDIPRISRTELTDPFEIENVSEKVSKQESQRDLGQLQLYRHIKPDQVFLGEKRFSDVENKGRVSTGGKTAIISKFREGEPDIDQRGSQIRVSQTIIQYSSKIQSSKSPVSPQDSSCLASTNNGNRESVDSSASCYTTERNKKKKSDQFDLDSPGLWRSRTSQIL
ncbi:hypothetical protein OnM2_059022 [Erysiphe neolycopersici]|uniref:Uncharacterized protein n=1 Tax=Erysiphe neolycopersici TaxID=212602 RepID=A0A420HQ33_9PEZI|nr:hypothetical protein OnM2_059022 [Erysiphe neolycopersici]